MNQVQLSPNSPSLEAATLYTIGVDIGGTNSEIGFVDRQGRCLRKVTLATMARQPFSLFKHQLVTTIEELMHDLGGQYQCLGLGVALPGAGAPNGDVRHPSNFAWPAFNIIEALSPHFSFPIHVTNDANAAAIGEKKYGKVKDLDNFVVITLGTGVGGGVFIDGQPLIGARGLAAELGHIVTVPGGRKCGCGKRGCLETYTSATGIRRTIMELIAEMGPANHGFNNLSFDQLTARHIFDAAQNNDPLALEAFRRTGTMLGTKMADLVPLFDPQAFVLFGGLTGAGPFLMEPVQAAFETNLGEPFQGKIPVYTSGVPYNEAAILGACHIPEFTN